MGGIWDTAGAERYRGMCKMYYRQANAAVVCFDPSDLKSFEKLRFWIEEMKNSNTQAKIYIVACKIDLIDEKVVKSAYDKHDLNDLTEEFSAKYFETSAKTGQNIREIFDDIAREYVSDPKVAENFDEETFDGMEIRSRL